MILRSYATVSEWLAQMFLCCNHCSIIKRML